MRAGIGALVDLAARPRVEHVSRMSGPIWAGNEPSCPCRGAPARRAPPVPSRSAPLTHGGVQRLQAGAGNAAVSRLLVQRELLAYHQAHTEILPSGGFSLSQT